MGTGASPGDAPRHLILLLPTPVVHDGRAEARPPRAGYSRLSRHRRAALVIVLIRKWWQPSGFTQNVERTQGIVSGQDVILQALGIITSDNLTIMLRTDEASGVRGSPRRCRSCSARPCGLSDLSQQFLVGQKGEGLEGVRLGIMDRPHRR